MAGDRQVVGHGGRIAHLAGESRDPSRIAAVSVLATASRRPNSA
jgi:hypothetical protein